jgi:hypothetical protein
MDCALCFSENKSPVEGVVLLLIRLSQIYLLRPILPNPMRIVGEGAADWDASCNLSIKWNLYPELTLLSDWRSLCFIRQKHYSISERNCDVLRIKLIM